jgi:hypothetical protein
VNFIFEEIRLRPPIQFLQPFSHFMSAHAHCNAHSPDGGFSEGTTGGISTSRSTSGHQVCFFNVENNSGRVDVLCHTMRV